MSKYWISNDFLFSDGGKNVVIPDIEILCPFSSVADARCGIWCPHFDGPKLEECRRNNGELLFYKTTVRLTCGGCERIIKIEEEKK
jgi:hypothetical protein